MSSNSVLNAYVLCGGQSRRMGQSKSNLMHFGSSFVDHIAQTAGPHFNAVIAVGKENQQINTRLPVITDQDSNHHPLWGIARAMTHSPYKFVFIIPCDLIQIQATGIQTLLRAQRPCYATAKHHSQPLLGVYPVDWLEHTVRCAEQNKSVHRWSTNASRISIKSSNLTNINHPWETP